ncbi:MAG: Gfo/Idh/MocA family oxidoreductase [Balneolales bacterium]
MMKLISRKGFIKMGTALAVSVIGFPAIILPKKKKLGVALVGLGRYSNGQLAPGLQLTNHCELRGIVTGSPEKIPVWQERYNIPDNNVYDYGSMHEIANNDDLDVVYIVLPPGLHSKYSIIGAESGKHVWCEKPMAMNVNECQNIINAAEQNNVKLSIGYRMQHEPNTQTIIRYGNKMTYGKVQEVLSGAGYKGSHQKDNWRAISNLGGGALYDMGVYPINASRYSIGENPIAVTGIQSSDRTEMYSEVDETTVFEMEFSGGTHAKGETSFGKSMNYLDVNCSDGWYKLRPFQSYSGVQGETSDHTILPPDQGHQQARQMDNDALAILENKVPIVPGQDGLEDIKIVQAIMESSRQGGNRIQL